MMEQIFETATRSLYPKLALFEALTEFKADHQRRPPNKAHEAQRNFLDSFAYLCDVERGGKTVTAGALQSLPLGNFLWLAANEGIQNPVKVYAENMLEALQGITPENSHDIQEGIFYRAVSFCSPRLKSYQTEMQNLATKCRIKLRDELPNDAGKMALSP